MKKLVKIKKLANLNTTDYRNELVRAHLIITFLCLIAVLLLMLGALFPTQLDFNLSITAGVLLILVAMISGSMSAILYKYKK